MNKLTAPTISPHLTPAEVCQTLSISAATLKNWLRLGKVSALGDGCTFDAGRVCRLAADIRRGEDPRLKSRRNKTGVCKTAPYRGYIENPRSIAAANAVLNACGAVTEAELRVVLAYLFYRLYFDSRGSANTVESFAQLADGAGDYTFNALMAGLLDGANLKAFDGSVISAILNIDPAFVPYEDLLGYIYISLKDLGERKRAGAYYTAAPVVRRLMGALLDAARGVCGEFLDPCCGTGNFLIGLLQKGVDSNRLYGRDVDALAVQIARINMYLLDGALSIDRLKERITCGDTLADAATGRFCAVLGNPPWGASFTPEQAAFFLNHYETCGAVPPESFCLFIEKGLSLLKDGGRLCYVLPEAFLTVGAHAGARGYLASRASVESVTYLGNIFPGVHCPAIILCAKKGAASGRCRVISGKADFFIEQGKRLNSAPFSFTMDDLQYGCLKAIESAPNCAYLKGSAKFALGIVTGNNNGLLKDTKEAGCEPVLRGRDVLKYAIKPPNSYIRFLPETFQQVAPQELYRAKEKLIYRFICAVPVFAYDGSGSLTLNSCNILIPQIEGLHIKYVLAVLNSSAAAYYFSKKFNSVKMLKSHIESLPIPLAGKKAQRCIIDTAEKITAAQAGGRALLYGELDEEIFILYGLSFAQRGIIKRTLSGKNNFLR